MRETASTPAHLMQLFADRAAKGDLSVLMELYEDDAVFQPHDGVMVQGHPQIAEALSGMMALDPRIIYDGDPEVLVVGDIALVKNAWTMTGSAPGGTAVEDSGISADVVRRQPEGHWLVLIDQPRGTHPA